MSDTISYSSDMYYGCQDNTTPAPAKHRKMRIVADQTDMSRAELQAFAEWHSARHPNAEIVVEGVPRTVPSNGDKVLLRIDRTDMSMTEVIEFIGWYQSLDTGEDVFMDGDAYAIVACRRESP